MAFSLFPKQVSFFDEFDKLATVAIKAAEYFHEITMAGTFNEETISKMREIEHEGDEITHGIFRNLNQTFITPFDREDIHGLANELDSIIDMFNTMTNRLRVYRLSGVNDDLVQFSQVIDKSVRAVAEAVHALRNSKKLQTALDHCIEVNRLENVGDTMRDTMLGKLFDNYTDPIFIIKWKEIYQDAETVLDVCEDVANVVESIVVKQG
jgi:predicted phosphate transport protein (TIGR00153 family)